MKKIVFAIAKYTPRNSYIYIYSFMREVASLWAVCCRNHLACLLRWDSEVLIINTSIERSIYIYICMCISQVPISRRYRYRYTTLKFHMLAMISLLCDFVWHLHRCAVSHCYLACGLFFAFVSSLAVMVRKNMPILVFRVCTTCISEYQQLPIPSIMS